MTTSEMGYFKAVRSIAVDAIAEYPFTNGQHSDERQEYVTESVDGSEYVIYYSNNEFVLRASNNEPDGAEVRAMSTDGADWQTMRTLAAYLAMEADVMAEVNRIFWEPFADGAQERYRRTYYKSWNDAKAAQERHGS